MWKIRQTPEFEDWFLNSDQKLQNDIVENVEILRQFCPHLSRPHVDTIKGSSITNLKELRFRSNKRVIRIFFVFDPDRNGVLVIGGNKAGSGDKNFYERMIKLSENIYKRYIVQNF